MTPTVTVPDPKVASVNMTPKARFLQDKDAVTAHNAMIERGSFELSTDAAMLEYQQQVLTRTDGNPNSALAGFYRILGAQEYLIALKNLAVRSIPRPVVHNDNLEHKA